MQRSRTSSKRARGPWSKTPLKSQTKRKRRRDSTISRMTKTAPKALRRTQGKNSEKARGRNWQKRGQSSASTLMKTRRDGSRETLWEETPLEKSWISQSGKEKTTQPRAGTDWAGRVASFRVERRRGCCFNLFKPIGTWTAVINRLFNLVRAWTAVINRLFNLEP